MYKYLKESWENNNQSQKQIQWRREDATTRIERPTRLDRARALGYKAKQGYILVRQRVNRGGHDRPTIRKARKSTNRTNKLVLGKNYQQICEERAGKKYLNCEVLNSYFVGKDGMHIWYEVILVDRAHPNIVKDDKISWISKQRGRAQRGITSAARRSRGLWNKGKGAEKVRPSLRAKGRRAH